MLVNDAPQIALYFYLTNGSGTWTSEDITSVLGDQSVLPRLLVTADGTVHLVGVGAHVWRVGGTWKKETLPADSADYAVSGFEAAALDDKGALYLAWEYLPPMAGQPDKVVTLSSANGWTESITEIGHGAVRQQTPILLFDAHGALRVFPIHYERLQYLTTVVSQCPSSR